MQWGYMSEQLTTETRSILKSLWSRDVHLKDAKKMIAAQLQKYQPIRGGQGGRKERWRKRGDRRKGREQKQIYK